MSTAVMAGKRVRLSEEKVFQAADLRVDRDAGIIRGVKVLGVLSSNRGGTSYPRSVISSAAALYEGSRVHIDHDYESEERSIGDRFGQLQNIRFVDGDDRRAGLYGDLHYLRAHPLAEQIVEMAERFPESFGLSHVADGRLIKGKDQQLEVAELYEVFSVDVVGRAATNESLFEGARPMKRKVRDILASPKSTKHKRLAARLLESWSKRLREAESGEETVLEAAMDAELEEAEQMDDDVAAALRKSIMEAMDRIEEMGLETVMEEIRDLVTVKNDDHGKKTMKENLYDGYGDEMMEAEDEDEEPNEAMMEQMDEMDDEEMMESLRAPKSLRGRVRLLEQRLRRERAIRNRESQARLCESMLVSAGRRPDDVRIKALLALSSDDDRQSLVESFPRDARPRPQRTGSALTQSDNLPPLSDVEAVRRWVRHS